ncbi:MAG: NUDIX domain-containing protein [Anaerolineaceae bacterium]|nr:NUDIX domain-containing protein [Anaerolineaceae bacterium]
MLLKGSKTKRLWANLYNGIGGHVEKNECIHSAAKRELFEETGLQINQLHTCGTIMVDASEDIGICIFVMKGFYDGGKVLNSDEGELFWMAMTELENLPLVEDLPMILPVVDKWQKGDACFAARSYYFEDKLKVVFEK